MFIWGLYRDARRAHDAVGALVEGSFPPEEISVLLRDTRGRERAVPIRHRTRAPLGAAVGATSGAIAGLVATGGSFELVGVTAIVGAATGAYAGLLWWRQEADIPAPEGGLVLVGISAPEGRAQHASDILLESGAEQVGTRRSSPPR